MNELISHVLELDSVKATAEVHRKQKILTCLNDAKTEFLTTFLCQSLRLRQADLELYLVFESNSYLKIPGVVELSGVELNVSVYIYISKMDIKISDDYVGVSLKPSMKEDEIKERIGRHFLALEKNIATYQNNTMDSVKNALNRFPVNYIEIVRMVNDSRYLTMNTKQELLNKYSHFATMQQLTADQRTLTFKATKEKVSALDMEYTKLFKEFVTDYNKFVKRLEADFFDPFDVYKITYYPKECVVEPVEEGEEIKFEDYLCEAHVLSDKPDADGYYINARDPNKRIKILGSLLHVDKIPVTQPTTAYMKLYNLNRSTPGYGCINSVILKHQSKEIFEDYLKDLEFPTIPDKDEFLTERGCVKNGTGQWEYPLV